MFLTFNQAVADMDSLRREIDSIFNRSWGPTQLTSRTFPLVNLYDSAEQLTLVAELPGVNKSDLDITYAEGVLKLAGIREAKSYGEKALLLRQERTTGRFEKTIKVPVQIEADGINASLQDGLLTVILPKAEAAKPKQIQIQA